MIINYVTRKKSHLGQRVLQGIFTYKNSTSRMSGMYLTLSYMPFCKIPTFAIQRAAGHKLKRQEQIVFGSNCDI